MKRTALALTLISALLFSAVAGTHFVKPVNARMITVPNDYSRIQSAIDVAVSGDTVFVKRGIYNETLVVNKPISLIGEDRNSTIINANKVKSQVILIQGDEITIANFTLGNNGYGPPTWKYWTPENGEGDGINILPTSNYITIANNTIISCPFDGINAHFSHYNLIVGNIIIHSAYGVLVGCVESTIANNTFANVSVGIEFTSYSADEGVNGGVKRWVLNESNIIQGNQNITLSAFPEIPEFSSLIILPLFMIATLLMTLIYFKKRKHQSE